MKITQKENNKKKRMKKNHDSFIIKDNYLIH